MRSFFMILAALWLCATAGCGTTERTPESATMIAVIDDFEKGVEDWDDSMGNAKEKPTIACVADARVGKQAAKISFSAAEKGGWTLLKHDIDRWPDDGTAIAFWIKATAPGTPAQVKLSEMSGDHTGYEGFKATFTVGTEWQRVIIPLARFEFLWSMSGDSNKRLDKEKISNIAFEQADETKPLTIVVDQLEIVK